MSRLVNEKGEPIEEYEDDTIFTLTPWGCLAGTLMDYGIDVSNIPGKIGKHLVEDFMETMARCGYVVREGDKQNDIPT